MSGHRTWRDVLAEHPLAERAHDPDFWSAYLQENPGILHHLLADIYQSVHGTERPPTLDDLWDLVSQPRFSNLPFPDALKEALGHRTGRWLATHTGLSKSMIHRLLTGERNVVVVDDVRGSMHSIEVISRALRIHPSYFAEWRRLWVMSLLDTAFDQRPELSAHLFRRFAQIEQRRTPSREVR